MQTGDKFVHNFNVTPLIYERFIEAYADKNPLHVDAAYAKARGFKDIVMFGNILNGFVSYFVGECLPMKNVYILSQSIKFAQPVYMNDVLEFNAEVTDYIEVVKSYGFKFYFKNQAGVKVAKGEIQIGLII